MDEMQEDYLNNQSEYFVPLSWKVIEDMYVLAGELADGMHDKEAHLDTGEEFFARHGSAMLAAVSYTHLDVYKRQRLPLRCGQHQLQLHSSAVGAGGRH